MVIKVGDLVDLFIDSGKVEIYDGSLGEVVFFGWSQDLTDELLEQEVSSIDALGYGNKDYITINIDSCTVIDCD